MRVYIIFDDCPIEYDEKSIVAVYSNKKGASDRVKRMKRDDPYMHQYLTIESWIVEFA